MKIGEIVKNYVVEHNISAREFAKKANLSNTYISNLINGSDKNPSLEAMKKIASAMGVSSQELFDSCDGDQLFSINKKFKSSPIPLYSVISCGTGIFVDDDVEEFLSIPDKFLKRGKEYYAITAYGDSMIGKGIKSGDIIVFEKTQTLDNGEVGAFCIGENDAVCKVFRKLSTGIILLESANDKYAPIEIDMSSECFRIIGRYKFKFSIEQKE